MPKRSNPFQQLIRIIYEQMVPEGASVSEPAELIEPSSGAKREVDILIEHNIAGAPIKMAIECRSRSRRDDLEWIDSLIGKYIDLPVDKKIAVSLSGFSAAAQRKAQKYNILTKSLDEAVATKWPDEFIRLGFGIITHNFEIEQVIIQTREALPDTIPLDPLVLDEHGRAIASLGDFLKETFQLHAAPRINEYLQQNWNKLFRTVADFEKTIRAGIPGNFGKPYFLALNDERYMLTSATFHVKIIGSYADASLNHFTFDTVMVSLGTVSGKEAVLPVAIIQPAGETYVRVWLGREREG